MRNLLLSTLSTLALLIHPLSLSAQNTFSLSLDMDSAASNQAVTSLNVSTDQVVTIQIFGNNIQNANGLAVRFEYDASQVVYEGFDTGDVFPSAQALPEQGTNPTYVEIGIVSFGGQATANNGLVGTVRFRATAAFSGTVIQLVRAELGRGGRFETIMPNIRIVLQGTPPPANFSLSLDVDGSAGDQAVTSVDVSTDEMVAIQIFGQDIRNANGLSIRFEYDASQVTYEGFDAGSVLPSAQALIEQGTNPTFIQIGIVSLGGQATVNSGLVGTIRFRTTATFSGTAIRLVRAELGRGGQIASATIDVRVELTLQVLTPDFNRDGVVDFADFLAFGGQYGSRQGDGRYDAKYDLDSDGAIGFGDFLIFSSSFGEEVSTSGGGSGGGIGNPDLIVESPSVSDSTLTTGQSFTLQATVRNQGSGQSAATTLRYYQSANAIISSSDTRVGSDAVGSLNASSSSIESISLNAPSSAGTYYYGACVSSVSGESDTGNNCSRAVRVTVSSGSNTVTIPDANLRAVIADSLGKARNASITRAEMASLTRLDAPNAGIRNLTGLEHATNLQSLDLGVNDEWVNSNEISDLSPLSSLTNLTVLDLRSNSISDITPLSHLNNLTYLGLWVNSISDITPLSHLNNLTSLDLGVNSISDITPLSHLNNLTELHLFNNSISDITPLSHLNNLTGLGLHTNSISDITPLSHLNNLTLLQLDNNRISDISPLVANTGLGSGDEVDVRNNPLSATSINTHVPALQSRGVEISFDPIPVVIINDPTPVRIPDANLRAAIEIRLNKARGATITRRDMSTLKRLDAPNSNIGDLTGLEFAISLTRLDLGTEWVSGEGSVNSNYISDLSPLSDLSNLTSLDIGANLISDVSALSGLTSLTSLYLSDNIISDVSALSGLTSLTSLYLSSNLISDVSALSGLTSLTSLYLSDNIISNIAPLSGLTSLERLYLSSNSISNIVPLSALTNLTGLSLSRNTISSISPLSALTSLESLVLWDNAISDVSALSGLTNLTYLDLDQNTISSISPLSALTSLETLYLSYNSISDVSALSGLTELEGLYLSSNSISNIAPLSALINLTGLSLSRNSISDISALSNLTNLTGLYLWRNSISDISPLSGLTNLTGLYLSSNSISDIAPLVTNTGLGSGDEVDVRNNPLSATSLNTHIPALQSRGVAVQFGALKPAVEEKERGIIREEWETKDYISRRRMAW